ncbi:hypothetical protein ACFSQE_09730 [Vogesella fluminis]|uniref:hypothetical protein n=1 Tax=Vogesella fluminis TaxID=1069161 RepID=UPI003630552C
MLHYPAAEYFFVTPRKPYLAEHIWQGLLRAQADGSFNRLFHAHFDPLLRRARLSQRRVIELPNPMLDAVRLLPADSPWWYRPLLAPGKMPAKPLSRRTQTTKNRPPLPAGGFSCAATQPRRFTTAQPQISIRDAPSPLALRMAICTAMRCCMPAT